MNTANPGLAWTINILCYSFIAEALQKVLHRHERFWLIFGIILGLRVAFLLVDMLSSTVVWRGEGKKAVVERVSQFLKREGFPKKADQFDFGSYLYAFDAGLYPAASDRVKGAASGMYAALEAFEFASQSADNRIRDAVREAFNRHQHG